MPPHKRGRSRQSPPPPSSPLDIISWYAGLEVPDIITFITSPQYLNRNDLYPRQATILKCMFLQDELFTDYDREVIEEWSSEYARGQNNGIQPDIYERIEWCKQDGRKWFREVVNVSGRRGGKGYIGALAMAYVLWNYMAKGDPQEYYGIDRSKKLVALIFAGKLSQAKDQLWADFRNVIIEAPCFQQYVADVQAEKVSVYAPKDFRRMREMAEKGVDTSKMNMATFEIIPKESTLMAGRGPASFCLGFDELAHVVASGSNRSAEEVWGAATPSLDQFGKDGFIYEPSSPWQMMGQFYQNYINSTARETVEWDEDGKTIRDVPMYPNIMMIQLTSWDPYMDWERAHEIPMYPGVDSPTFKRKKGAIQAYDLDMQKLEQSNPDTFSVERRSHFQTALDAYLNPQKVDAMFTGEWLGKPIVQQAVGHLAITYKAHGDPALVNDRFGFAIAHGEMDQDTGMMHAVFDIVHFWEAPDFPGNTIDYIHVEKEIWGFIQAFKPDELTFDQWNCQTAETLVPTEYGLLTLREIIGPDHSPKSVVPLDTVVEAHHSPAVAQNGYYRGLVPTKKIKTKLGYAVEATPEHRYYVRKNKIKPWHTENPWKYEMVSDIAVGDWLCIRRNGIVPESPLDITPFWPAKMGRTIEKYPNILTVDLAEAMGLLLAEGDYTAEHVRFGNSEDEVILAYADRMRSTFGGTWNTQTTDEWMGKYHWGLVRKAGATAQFLSSLGLTGASTSKVVPWSIRQSNKDAISGFLRGYFEGDGGVVFGRPGEAWVEATTTSKEVAEVLQQLLLLVGVFCTKWEGTYRYKGESRRQWRIKLYGLDLLDFATEVGFLCARKINELDKAVETVKSIGNKCGIRSKHQRNGDEYWTRIVAIEDSQADCYDLSVPGPTSYVGNGIVGHNSASSIQKLQMQVRQANFNKRVQVFCKPATRQYNFQRAETFKTALNMGWIHAPASNMGDRAIDVAVNELKFLQFVNGKVDHPDMGPVQSKDVADCLMECVQVIVGDQVNNFLANSLGNMRPLGMMEGGVDALDRFNARDGDNPGLAGFLASRTGDRATRATARSNRLKTGVRGPTGNPFGNIPNPFKG